MRILNPSDNHDRRTAECISDAFCDHDNLEAMAQGVGISDGSNWDMERCWALASALERVVEATLPVVMMGLLDKDSDPSGALSDNMVEEIAEFISDRISDSALMDGYFDGREKKS